ncbi:MAG: OmpA family protein [Rhodobacteraceae bacterium]|nr:OmpA family protein [Paracoccaceae bacterium]
MLIAAPGMVSALSLDLPENAARVAQQVEALDSYAVPVGPYHGNGIAALSVEGEVNESAWRLPSSAQTTLQIMTPLREQLVQDGFEILFECDDRECGGFDFRYAINVLPEPDMHVDLGDYRFLTARRAAPGKEAEYICLIVSRSANAGYVQMTRVGPEDARPVMVSSSMQSFRTAAEPQVEPQTIQVSLETEGRLTLEDLSFEVGSSRLGTGPFDSLESLAAYLNANPDREVVLVGHSDADGSLEANIALSKARAASVAERLVQEYGVAAGQVSSDGVGFLMPLASNLTEEGRTQNRRVEVVLTSTQ